METEVENEICKDHLGYIQGVITRMGQNSFQCKAWCITLVSALLVIYIEQPNNKPHTECIWIADAVILLFGFLDAYYLYLERGYRYLYNVAAHIEKNCAVENYDMKIPKEKRGLCNYFKSFVSVSTGLFYGAILVLILLLVRCITI